MNTKPKALLIYRAQKRRKILLVPIFIRLNLKSEGGARSLKLKLTIFQELLVNIEFYYSDDCFDL